MLLRVGELMLISSFNVALRLPACPLTSVALTAGFKVELVQTSGQKKPDRAIVKNL